MSQILPLAIQFSRNLKEFLGQEVVDSINQDNIALDKESPRFCATYFYCDPNQLMIDACESVGLDPFENMPIVNGAWRLARKYGFKEERLALLLDPHTLSAVCSNKYMGVIQCA
jgi:hypothetical protein